MTRRLLAALTVTLGLAALALAAPARAFTKDSLVWKKCADCHAPMPDGRLSRVEELRTTPEEWTVIVDRMRRLHKMPLTKAEMDRLLKELCATQLLTPDEQEKVAYLSLFHNSQQMEAPEGKDEERMFATCVRCHSAGKIRSYRMTPANWARVRDFHLWLDPAVIFQMREMHWREEAAAVLEWLAGALPYGTAWTAPARDVAGRYAVFGREPGRGTYRGEVELRGGKDGEYEVSGKLRHADGKVEPFEGEATLYGGYALRTRVKVGGELVRGAWIVRGEQIAGESHFPAPRFRTSSATWLRVEQSPWIVRVTPGFLIANEKTRLRVEGIGLPDVTAKDVAFGGGQVAVLSARRVDPGAIELEVVSKEPGFATASVSLKNVSGGSVALAPAIDHIAVVPEMGRARVSGGRHYPAEGVQFEAIAYARKPAAGGQPASAGPGQGGEAIALGPVPATFTLAEEKTRDGDDDLKYAGKIAPSGSYAPPGDYAPRKERGYSAEATGLVKVVARYPRGGKTFTAEARLAFTVPDFIQRIR